MPYIIYLYTTQCSRNGKIVQLIENGPTISAWLLQRFWNVLNGQKKTLKNIDRAGSSKGRIMCKWIGSESVLRTESKLERFSTENFCNSLYL